MNALEAGNKIAELKERRNALTTIIDYMDDDRDFRDQIYVLNEIKDEVVVDLENLEDKLRAVQL
jgi:hypothetical protein